MGKVKVNPKHVSKSRKQIPKTVEISIEATLSRTTTTIRFRGRRMRFITAERDSSGMYLPFKVPVSGQCIPQTTSKTRKDRKHTFVFCMKKHKQPPNLDGSKQRKK